MQFRVFAAISCLLALTIVNTVDAAVDPVSLAVIVIAGIAIAKEKLVAAEIHRQYIRRPAVESYGAPSSGYGQKRGKRQAETDATFDPMFDSALQLDTDDCAKLMVCHVFEKPVEQLNSFEAKIQKLFAHDLNKIEAESAKAEYQLAAYVGSLHQSGLCQQRYNKCLANPQELTKLNL
jgi:hypothetical protein